MVLNSKVVVKDSGIAGKGLVATEPIKAGEVIWHADAGDSDKFFFPKAEVESWPEEERTFFMNFAYVVSPGIYSGVRRDQEHLTDKSQYMNHCCKPNVAFRGDEEMVAVEDIAAGSEVVYDYCTSETTGLSFHLPFTCSCGHAACRGGVTGDDWRKADIQERYKGRFTSMVQKLIDDAAAATA